MPRRKTDGDRPVATRAGSRERKPSKKAIAAREAEALARASTARRRAKALPKSQGERVREELDDDAATDGDATLVHKDEDKKEEDVTKKSSTSQAQGQRGPKDAGPVPTTAAHKKTSSLSKAASGEDMSIVPQKIVVTLVGAERGPADTHYVLSTPECVWDALLNQTNLEKNTNKYYIMQVLRPYGSVEDAHDCILYTRGGRVGGNGRCGQTGPLPLDRVLMLFKRQFKRKTGVCWEQRAHIVPKKGKYIWLERSSIAQYEMYPRSTLPAEIQTLCKLIYNDLLFDTRLSSMNYDMKTLPIGNLSQATVQKGYTALKAISEVIAEPNSDTCKARGGFEKAIQTLTEQYYSIIPHDFGRRRPTVIDNIATLKQELTLLDALDNMEVASKIIQSSTTIPRDADGCLVNQLDAHFRGLQLSKMELVVHASHEFEALKTYLLDMHGETHRDHCYRIQHVFRIEREVETQAWTTAGFEKLADGERLLLWHGSSTTNFVGILRNGLRIRPPEAPSNGSVFGKGVYFADMLSKSARYCTTDKSDNIGLLLLCEVAAKPFLERYTANMNAETFCKAAGARATKGVGLYQPSGWQDAGDALNRPELRGCHMPKGPPTEVVEHPARVHEPTRGPMFGLVYNEYIVYDTSQIRMRYLVMVSDENLTPTTCSTGL